MIARSQLREVGLSEEGVAQAIASGRLHPLFWTTYAVGHRPVGLHVRLMAATLACGEGTVVSHGSAAWLLGLWRATPGDIEVIAPIEAGRKIPGIRRRFVPTPSPEHIVTPEGIPCTHYSLPIPETNARLRAGGRTFEVDFLWRSQRVVVETDGGRFHDNPLAQQRDATRNQLLARAGYRVPRLGWDQLRDEPEQTIAEIARFLRSPTSPVP